TSEPAMDSTLKPWVDPWDYLDGNFWHVWQWSRDQLRPEEAGWQPAPTVASIGWNLQHLGEMLDHYLTHVLGQPGPVAEHESYHLGKCTLLRSLLTDRRARRTR